MESYHATITVVASLLSAGFALLCREGLTAWLKYRADQRIDKVYEDEKEKTGYEKLIASQEKRISTLEQVVLKSQADHMDCVKVSAGLKVQVDFQQEELARQDSEIQKQQEEINTLRKRLNDTREINKPNPQPQEPQEPKKPQ